MTDYESPAAHTVLTETAEKGHSARNALIILGVVLINLFGILWVTHFEPTWQLEADFDRCPEAFALLQRHLADTYGERGFRTFKVERYENPPTLFERTNNTLVKVALPADVSAALNNICRLAFDPARPLSSIAMSGRSIILYAQTPEGSASRYVVMYNPYGKPRYIVSADEQMSFEFDVKHIEGDWYHVRDGGVKMGW